MTFDPPRRFDPEAPEEDVAEQATPLIPDPEDAPELRVPAFRDPEVPEADALEQARDVPYDDDYSE